MTLSWTHLSSIQPTAPGRRAFWNGELVLSIARISNPFHWAKIRNTDKNYFVIYYNRLYPQNFIKGDFSKINEKFVGKEEGKILT